MKIMRIGIDLAKTVFQVHGVDAQEKPVCRRQLRRRQLLEFFTKPADLAGKDCLLLASTFGDGDPPDNAGAFWNALQADGTPRLTDTRFAVLAFGDSNYDQFCGFGRKLDQRLGELGAQRLSTRADCEPEFQETAKTWLEAVSLALQGVPAAMPQPALVLAGDIETAVSEVVSLRKDAPKYSRTSPLHTRVLLNRLLNEEGSAKETRQYAFDLKGSSLTYEAGDALGVWPTNCPSLVGDILSTLKLTPATAVKVKDLGEMTLSEALLQHYEIARITPELLKLVRDKSGSSMLEGLLGEERKAELKQWLWGRQLIDLFQDCPLHCDAQELLSVLKRLQPRLYSISSSPKAFPDEVHLTVSTVRYGSKDKRRDGVCSSFLADRSAHGKVPIFVQKSAHFRPPKDTQTPMIMVGPGTGIAPFRAFLQERRAVGATGKNWLFFGEQQEATDFYYRDELHAWVGDGHLHRLDTAFSRDQAKKAYVQHRMLEQGAQLWAWLQEGAHFYVCGDASRMAKDVDAALKQVAHVHGGLSQEEAAAYFVQMASDKRLVRDVY